VVHENLLIHHSKFFRAALTGGFQEAKNKIVRLEDDEPNTFELFVHWLYYQRFPEKRCSDDESILELWNDPDAFDTDRYIYLYVFGDKYDVAKLRLDTLNEMVRFMRKEEVSDLPSSRAVGAAFSSLPSDSPMCRLIVDIHCRYEEPKQQDCREDFDNVLFLQSLWRKYAKFRMKAEIKDNDFIEDVKFCDYHEHDTKEERAACDDMRKKSKQCACKGKF
jgi:hypothetical protein